MGSQQQDRGASTQEEDAMNEIEQALIVAGVMNPDGAAAVEVTPDHFSTESGRAVWLEILKTIAAGDPVDGVTLQNRLSGPALRAFADAMTITASPGNIDSYAKQVIRASDLRSLCSLADRVKERANVAGPEEIASELLTGALSIGKSDRQTEFSAKQLMAETVDRVDAAATGKQLGLKTGWRAFDKKLGGWHAGDLTIIAGRPGMGKSAIGVGAAIQAAKLGAKVGFVSSEMDAVSLGMRMAASEANLSVSSLRLGTVHESSFAEFAAATSRIAKLPLRVLDAPGWSMKQIVRQCHAWSRTGLDMVVIDYLQRVQPDVKSDRHDLAIGEMAKDCKTMASTLQIPVLLLSQLSRQVEQRQDKRPGMSDLRESGQIEQEADNVLMLYRGAVYDDLADPREGEVLVEKQRQGPVGIIPMLWDGEQTRWVDPS